MKNITLIFLLFLVSLLLLQVALKPLKPNNFILSAVRGFWPGMALHLFMYETLSARISGFDAALIFIFISAGIFFSIFADYKGGIRYLPVIIISGQAPAVVFGVFGGSLTVVVIMAMMIIDRSREQVSKRYMINIALSLCFIAFVILIKSSFLFLVKPMMGFSGGALIYYCFSLIFSKKYKYDIISASWAILGFLFSLVFYFDFH